MNFILKINSKSKNNKRQKREKGITLIALVVTIVILLILAGISINLVLGNNGIIAKAKEAKYETRAAAIQDEVDLWMSDRFAAEIIGEEPKPMDQILSELQTKGILTEDEVKEIKSNSENSITIGNKVISFGVMDKIEGNVDDWEYTVKDSPKTASLTKTAGFTTKIAETTTKIATLTKYKGKDTEVVVPNYINGIPVKAVGSGKWVDQLWDKSICSDNKIYEGYAQETITKVIISRGIEKISAYAFAGSTALEEIVLPDTLKTIENTAFARCNVLESITLPSSLEKIDFARYNSTMIASDFPGLKHIYVSPNNKNYKDIDGVLFSKDGKELIFYPSNRLETSYTIPSSVNTIKSAAFANCSQLNEIKIPETVTKIEYSYPGTFTNGPKKLVVEYNQNEIPSTWTSSWNSNGSGGTINTVYGATM